MAAPAPADPWAAIIPPADAQLGAHIIGFQAAAAAAAATVGLGAAAAGQNAAVPNAAQLWERMEALSANLLAERNRNIALGLEVDLLKEYGGNNNPEFLIFARKAEISIARAEAMELIPNTGDKILDQKLQPLREQFILSRTMVAALSQNPPNIELALDLAGQLSRLANNYLVGVKLAMESGIDPKKKYSVPEAYFELTCSEAKRTKLDWQPETHLEVDKEQRKEVRKVAKLSVAEVAALAAQVAARARGGGSFGNGGGASGSGGRGGGYSQPAPPQRQPQWIQRQPQYPQRGDPHKRDSQKPS